MVDTTATKNNTVLRFIVLVAIPIATLLFFSSLYAFAEVQAPDLKSAKSFAVLAATGITNAGETNVSGVAGGDMGSYPTPAFTGAAGVTTSGTIYDEARTAADNEKVETAKADLRAVLDAPLGAASTLISDDLIGQTLESGIYNSTATLALTGELKLDAKGNTNAVFIFVVGTSLDAAAGANVTLENGAQAGNVFWLVGTSATFAAASSFVGSILAKTTITAAAGARFQGQLLALDGAVTLSSNNISNTGAVFAYPDLIPAEVSFADDFEITNQDNADLNVEFSEPVSVLADAEVLGCESISSSFSDNVLSIALAGCDDGEVVVSLAANSVSDSAGNLSPAAVLSKTFIVDTVAPEVSAKTATVEQIGTDENSYVRVSSSLLLSEGSMSADAISFNGNESCQQTQTVVGVSVELVAQYCQPGEISWNLAANSVTDLAGNIGPVADVVITATVTEVEIEVPTPAPTPDPPAPTPDSTPDSTPDPTPAPAPDSTPDSTPDTEQQPDIEQLPDSQIEDPESGPVVDTPPEPVVDSDTGSEPEAADPRTDPSEDDPQVSANPAPDEQSDTEPVADPQGEDLEDSSAITTQPMQADTEAPPANGPNQWFIIFSGTLVAVLLEIRLLIGE